VDKIKKSLDTNDIEIKSIDEKKRIIWHKISKEVTDRMGDIVVADGIDTRRFKKKPGVLADHNYYGGNPPPVVGENVGFKLEGKTTYAGTKFFDPDNKELSQSLRDLSGDHYTLHKMKLLGWSIGFIPLETEEIKNKEGGVTGLKFKKSELLEYSSVIIPANQEAIDNAFKKGVITKEFADTWPKKKAEPLPGEMAERILTEADVGKLQGDVEKEQLESTELRGISPDLIQALRDLIGVLTTTQKSIAAYLRKFQIGGKNT